MAFQTTTTGRSIRPAFNLYAKDKEIEKEEEEEDDEEEEDLDDDDGEYYYESDIEEDDDDNIDFVMPSTDKLISDIPESERGIGVGIDLGTTNSAISILGSDNNPILIPVPVGIDEEGDLEYASTIPSIVTIVDEEDVYVGENMEGRGQGNGNHGGAYAYAYEYRHVKRIIGMGMMAAAGSAEVVPHLAIRTASQRRKGKSLNKKNIKEGKVGGGMKLDHILREAKDNPAMLLLPPGVNFDDDDDSDSSNDTDGDVNVNDIVDDEEDLKTISPEFISAQVLRKLFETAENATEERITRAVIGVPAYFNDVQREATVRAATMASSIPAERIRLLREPEAAALAYGIGKQQIGKGDEEELVLVFDLGGGTFDVSILEVGGGIYEVVATGGNNMLGGSDFDAKIAQYISKKVTAFGEKGTKNFWKEGGDVADKMVTTAEQIRIALSNTRELVMCLPLTAEGWLELEDTRDSIIVPPSDMAEYAHIDEQGLLQSNLVMCRFTRKAMEQLCLDEFLALLRPVRETAILAGAMLPGDSSPSAVEAVLQMEEELDMELADNAARFEDFYDEESGEAKSDSDRTATATAGGDPDPDDEISAEMLLQLKEHDFKNQKKKQQKGRKRARNTQKQERKFREQKRKADEEAKRSPTAANVKVRDGINGRRLTQVVLVGGATRMPAIGRLLAATTGVVPQKTVNPDECVALGCAVQVGILDGINTELQVLSPIEAAMMRALAKKRGMDTNIGDEEDDDDDFFDDDDFGGDVEGGLSEAVSY